MRSRVKSTYLYFTASLGTTALSAYYLSRSQMLYRIMSGNRWLVKKLFLEYCSLLHHPLTSMKVSKFLLLYNKIKNQTVQGRPYHSALLRCDFHRVYVINI